LFVALYAIISALFTGTTVFFPNYSSGYVKTNSIWPVSVCLAFFEAIWHFFTSGLAFIVHLDLAILLAIHLLRYFACCVGSGLLYSWSLLLLWTLCLFINK